MIAIKKDAMRYRDPETGEFVGVSLIGGDAPSGISTTAKNLLITILRSGVYTADQSANITSLETALGGGTTEPVEPDVPVETTYAISNELINCMTSNSTSSVKENAAYSATLTANDGYTLTGGTVTVTMGGVDITSTAYADGVISIAVVTGDVEIIASAVQVSSGGTDLPEIVTDGLLDYFDLRNAEIAYIEGTNKAYGWRNENGALLFSWQNITGKEISKVYGAKNGIGKYSHDGTVTETDLGTEHTVVALCYGGVMPNLGFVNTNIRPWWNARPKYVASDGSNKYAENKQIGLDDKSDWNFIVHRVNGQALTLIMDSSTTEYNGTDYNDFSKWNSGNDNGVLDGYNTALAIYNRALTDVEIEEMRAFMKTLEVDA